MTTVLAVDLGGSKILACLVQEGQVVDERQVPTPRAGGADAWLSVIGEIGESWEGRFALVGMAVTGIVRRGHWYALNPDTLPVPQGFMLETELTRRLHVPVTACNDAQAAAWGEHVAGAGKGIDDLVFVTVSTGIGGGVILGGRLLLGRGGIAGSIGQMRIEHELRVEDVASGRGIAKLAAESGHDTDAARVFAAAHAGEDWAVSVLAQAVDAGALLFRNLQYVYDPVRIVVGGGVGLAEGYLHQLRSRLADVPEVERPDLVPAALSNRAGILGIADLALREAAATREEQSL
ncbi:MAG TPA: ROK family protein [Geminicoccus sp.]|jgi:predicted NBD/HSP70 family sugar kinase|nr:ROK family protein [Geminicoccus sp.]HEX2527537.1 ROK family protein [Geminicoccus sp.]